MSPNRLELIKFFFTPSTSFLWFSALFCLASTLFCIFYQRVERYFSQPANIKEKINLREVAFLKGGSLLVLKLIILEMLGKNRIRFEKKTRMFVSSLPTSKIQPYPQSLEQHIHKELPQSPTSLYLNRILLTKAGELGKKELQIQGMRRHPIIRYICFGLMTCFMVVIGFQFLFFHESHLSYVTFLLFFNVVTWFIAAVFSRQKVTWKAKQYLTDLQTCFEEDRLRFEQKRDQQAHIQTEQLHRMAIVFGFHLLEQTHLQDLKNIFRKIPYQDSCSETNDTSKNSFGPGG